MIYHNYRHQVQCQSKADDPFGDDFANDLMMELINDLFIFSASVICLSLQNWILLASELPSDMCKFR